MQKEHPENQYLSLLHETIEEGSFIPNRTGIGCFVTPGGHFKFNLQDGFPAITTKQLYFNQMKGELIAFLQGKTSAADFRKLGCKFWDDNANHHGVDSHGNMVENKWLSNPNRKGADDLGAVYGWQWRHWEKMDILEGEKTPQEDGSLIYNQAKVKVSEIDQVMEVLHGIKHNPENRRLILSAWRPDHFDKMALPPCHVLYNFIADPVKNKLHLCMYQRSADMFLGVPMNIASASLMLMIFARITGYEPGTFHHFLGNVHVYENSLDVCKIQLSREPKELPYIEFHPDFIKKTETFNPSVIDELIPEWFVVKNYTCHGPLAAKMAI